MRIGLTSLGGQRPSDFDVAFSSCVQDTTLWQAGRACESSRGNGENGHFGATGARARFCIRVEAFVFRVLTKRGPLCAKTPLRRCTKRKIKCGNFSSQHRQSFTPVVPVPVPTCGVSVRSGEEGCLGGPGWSLEETVTKNDRGCSEDSAPDEVRESEKQYSCRPLPNLSQAILTHHSIGLFHRKCPRAAFFLTAATRVTRISRF